MYTPIRKTSESLQTPLTKLQRDTDIFVSSQVDFQAHRKHQRDGLGQQVGEERLDSQRGIVLR